jgi:hypothetical protein
MLVAAKAFHFEIAIPGVDRIAERRLGRTLKAEHQLIPRLDRESVGLVARFGRRLRRRPYRHGGMLAKRASTPSD